MTSDSYQKIDDRLKQNGEYAYPWDKQSFDALIKEYKNEINEVYYFLDFLSQSGEYDYDEYYEQLLKKAKTIIEENLSSNGGNKRIKDKYVWFKNYLLDICQKKRINYANL